MKEIELSKGYVALVDDEDYEALMVYPWHAWVTSHNVYARRIQYLGNYKNTFFLMHRQIMEFPEKLHIDHIDNNGLNNTRVNLRVCTYSQNMMNQRKTTRLKTSKFKGVIWDKEKRKWVAQIYSMKKCYKLGSFKDEAEAALAYDRAARQMFGEFARPNFPETP